MVEDYEDDLPDDFGENIVDLGPCCRCGRDEGNVRTLVMLNHRTFYAGPEPKNAWGCAQCGLPSIGAIASLCDQCAEELRTKHGLPKGDTGVPNIVPELRTFMGPGKKERLSIDLLDPRPFGHNMWLHPEVANPRRLEDFVLRGWADAADVCEECGVRYRARAITAGHGYGSVEWRADHKPGCELAGDDGFGEAGWDLGESLWAIGPEQRQYPAYLRHDEIVMCLECRRLITSVPLWLFIGNLAWAFCLGCFPTVGLTQVGVDVLSA